MGIMLGKGGLYDNGVLVGMPALYSTFGPDFSASGSGSLGYDGSCDNGHHAKHSTLGTV
jgi:hypothetical protein